MDIKEITGLFEKILDQKLNPEELAKTIMPHIDERVKAALEALPKSAVMTGEELEARKKVENPVTFSKWLGDMVRMRSGEGPMWVNRDDQANAYIKAIEGMSHAQLKAMVPEGRKALSESTAASAGYLVPTEESRELLNLVDNYAVVERLCRNVPMRTNSIIFPTLTAGLTAYWIPEATTATGTTQAQGVKQESNITVGQMTITAHVCAILVYVSTQLLDDSDPSVDQVLYNLFAETLADAFDEAILRGAGTATDPVTGLANLITTNIQQVGATFDFDDIRGLIRAVKVNGRKMGTIEMLGHYVAKDALMGIKDNNGQYIYHPAVREGDIDVVWGHRFHEDNNVSITLGAGNDKSRIFAGDFARHAFVGTRNQIIIKANPWGEGFERNQVAFLAEFRKGFQVSREGNFGVLEGVPTA